MRTSFKRHISVKYDCAGQYLHRDSCDTESRRTDNSGVVLKGDSRKGWIAGQD
jgi:hypothetical protein